MARSSQSNSTRYTAEQRKDIEEKDDNMLIELQKERLREEFLTYLEDNIPAVEHIISNQLFLRHDQPCSVAQREAWLYGDFNVCIPVSVQKWKKKRVLPRCPFPHMLGDMDEKVRCDAAVCAWILQYMQVPIPHVWGFGTPTGQHFTLATDCPWHMRLGGLLARPTQKHRNFPFLRRRILSSLSLGYLLVDFIEAGEGVMIANVWPPKNAEQKRNFYRSLSKLILGLASHPLNKTGSFTILDTGEMCLSNRPLTHQLALIERQGILTGIPRSTLYSNTVLCFSDLLDCLFHRFRHQPNAAHDEEDALAQLAYFTVLRTKLFKFTQKKLREGPSIMRFTNLSPSNIFVNDQYNIISIPNMEWCCALPVKTLCPPYWLGGRAIDEYDAEAENTLMVEYEHFMRIFEHEDQDGTLTRIVKSNIENGVHWYMNCLSDPRATYGLYVQNVQPRFTPEHATHVRSEYKEIVAPYWAINSSALVEQKLPDYQNYLVELNAQLQT